MAEIRLLLVTGSTRRLSTNSAALYTARELLNGHTTTVYDGLPELPAFNPDDDHEPLPETVRALRALIADADAVLFSTPEYAGTLPGSFKNLLDWTVGAGRSTAHRRHGSTSLRPDAAMARMLRFVWFSATWGRGSWNRVGYACRYPTTRSARTG
jgi:NAD(P)H-dependent FMN reductase